MSNSDNRDADISGNTDEVKVDFSQEELANFKKSRREYEKTPVKIIKDKKPIKKSRRKVIETPENLKNAFVNTNPEDDDYDGDEKPENHVNRKLVFGGKSKSKKIRKNNRLKRNKSLRKKRR
jgi:hypothetical protein